MFRNFNFYYYYKKTKIKYYFNLKIKISKPINKYCIMKKYKILQL